MAWREPPRAFAATSAAAKNPRPSARSARIYSSSPAASECLGTPRSVALVELVASHFLARFGAEMFCHEWLESGAYPRGHRDSIDLLARIEKARRLAVTNGDNHRSRARLGLLIGIGFQHAPHDEDLRIAGSEVEVIALPFRGMQLDRVTGNAPARGDGIGSQGLRRVLGIGVKLD